MLIFSKNWYQSLNKNKRGFITTGVKFSFWYNVSSGNMDVNSEESVARLESLLKWVNTFDGIHCNSFNDLSTGVHLLKCLQSFTPDVRSNSTEDPWNELFSILEEFCGSSLQRAVSKETILAGDNEHISRVVVLLLCVAVQSKENEKIIGDIMSMDVEAQRDIMFYIESTMAKVKSHAIVAGTFVSGVGEQLPSLEDKSGPPSPRQAAQGEELESSPVQTLAREPSDEIHPFPTPRRPPKTLQPSNFYNGLDSLAGTRLLMSPAVTRSFKSSKLYQSDLVNSVRGPLKFESQELEELSLLRHKVRVLKGSLDVENKLARDYYNELCAKVEEHEQLKKSYCKLESKLECQQQLSDLQDELSYANMDLATAQKSLASYKEQAESVERYKEKVLDMESQLKDYDQTMRQLDELKAYSQNMEISLMEKVAAMKRLELSLSKVTIELETRSSHLDELLQENREHKAELHEREKQCTSLENTIRQLEGKLESKEGTEIATSEQKREMSVQIETLQESVRSGRAEISSLMAEKHVTKVHMASLQEEINQLRTELNARITELASKDFRIQSVESNVKVLDSQFSNLELRAKELEHDLLQKENEITANKNNLSSITSHKTRLEAEVKNLQQQVAVSEESVSKLKETLSTKESKVASLTYTCSQQEAEITRLTQKCAEQLSSLQNAGDSTELLKSEKSELQILLQTVRRDMISAEESFSVEKERITSSQQELQADVELLRKKVSEQEDELAANQEKISALAEERDNFVSCVKSECSAKEAKLNAITAAAQEELATIKMEMKAIKEMLANETSGKASLSQQIVLLQSKFNGDYEALSREHSSLELAVAERNKTITTLQEECCALKEEISQQKVANRELVEKLDEILRNNKSHLDKLNEECGRVNIMQAENCAKDEIIHDLQEVNQTLKLESIELKKTVELIQEEKITAMETLNGVQAERDSLSERLVELKSIMQAENCAKDEMIQDLQEVNQSLKLESIELKKIVELVQAEKITAKETLNDVQAERDSLSERLVDFKSELSAAESRCTVLTSCHEAGLKAMREMSLLKEDNLALRERYKLVQLDLEAQEGENEKNKATIGQVEQELKLSSSHLDKQSRLIDSLTRENNKIMHENNKLQGDLALLETYKKTASLEEHNSGIIKPCRFNESRMLPVGSEEREGKMALLPRKELVTRASKSFKLEVIRVPTIETELPMDSQDCLQECTSRSTILTEGTWSSDSKSSSTESLTYKRLLRSAANLKTESSKPMEEVSRITELKRRNKRALPHLKSSYPVEMQVQPETVLNSDHVLKNQKSKIRRTTGTSTSEEQEDSAAQSARSEHYSKQKRDLEATWQWNEMVTACSSSENVNSPLTPETPADCYRRKQPTTERRSLQKSLHLRAYLNQPYKQSQSSQGTAFDIVLSPPKGKLPSLPKRLRERPQRGIKSDKSGNLVPSSSNSSTTAVKKGSPGTRRTSRNLKGTKLKPKD